MTRCREGREWTLFEEIRRYIAAGKTLKGLAKKHGGCSACFEADQHK